MDNDNISIKIDICYKEDKLMFFYLLEYGIDWGIDEIFSSNVFLNL